MFSIHVSFDIKELVDSWLIYAGLYVSDYVDPPWRYVRNMQTISSSLTFTFRVSQTCSKYLLETDNITEHLICFCQAYDSERTKLWDAIIDQVGYGWYRKLTGYPPLDQRRLILVLAGTNDTLE